MLEGFDRSPFQLANHVHCNLRKLGRSLPQEALAHSYCYRKERHRHVERWHAVFQLRRAPVPGVGNALSELLVFLGHCNSLLGLSGTAPYCWRGFAHGKSFASDRFMMASRHLPRVPRRSSSGGISRSAQGSGVGGSVPVLKFVSTWLISICVLVVGLSAFSFIEFF